MKLLLTSGGVTNASIRDALVELLGKPIAESTALCIPTAQYGHPMVGPGVMAWQFISGNAPNPMVDLGWKSVGVLELTALPSIGRERWVPLVRETDALLVGGGDVLYLCHWMRESGLTDLLPSLSKTVWVGLSAGSMVMTPSVGDEFIQWRPPTGDETTLGVVDFSICPHLAADGMPGNSMAEAEQWAAGIPNTAYAMDDQTAITVVDGDVNVVSEGHWEQLRTLSSDSRLVVDGLSGLTTLRLAGQSSLQARSWNSLRGRTSPVRTSTSLSVSVASWRPRNDTCVVTASCPAQLAEAM